MLNSVHTGLAFSTAALACAIAGCASPQGRTAVATSFGGKADGDTGLALRALTAMNANDLPAATGFAERAVARTPDDAGYRALLGNIYFAGGRFASAESAYKDALSIYSNQPQVVLKLALVEIAQGKSSEAAAFLDAARDVLDPADYGLALALSGHAADAAIALRDAARAPGADSRVRQNLALAYALSGDWANARVVAAQDLAADQVDARIRQWMKLASPGRPSDQVAALTGVTPAAVDPGQPVRLALRKADTNTAQAPAPLQALPAVAPQPQPQVEPQAPAVTVQADPQPEFVAPAPEPVFAQSVAPPPPPVNPQRVAAAASDDLPPATAFAAAEQAAALPPVARPSFTRAASPLRKPVRLLHAAAPNVRPSALRRGGSTAVVQLGAYGSPQRVLAAWNAAAGRHSALRAYAPMSAGFDSARGKVYRLSVRGFASSAEANGLCTTLRRAGGNCFVRTVAGDAPVRIASR